MAYPKIRARKGTVTKARLVPGEYESVVTDVFEADGYLPGTAFTVKYHLTRDGNVFAYEETFIDDERNPRTARFLRRLEEEGYDIEDLSSIIGMQEKLGLYKEQVGRGVYLNICQREHIGHEADA